MLPLTTSRGRAMGAGGLPDNEPTMPTVLCADGHVIGQGRETCDRDGLGPSTDEFGAPITSPTDEIMTDEVPAAEEAAAEDTSAEESTEAAADAVEGEAAEEASTEETTEGEEAAADENTSEEATEAV